MPLSALVLVEMVSLQIPTGGGNNEMEIKGRRFEGIIEVSKRKKDKWSSREEAREWMSQRSIWKGWDQRGLDLFVVSSFCSKQ